MSPKTRKLFYLSLVLSLVLFATLAAAQHSHDHGAPAVSSPDDQKLMNELKGKNGTQAIDIANQWRLKKLDVVSFVTPEAVHFKFKSGTEISIPLPEDQMMVSIAPYITWTHPCTTHYISKCDAELKDTPVTIKAVTTGGKTVIDGTFRSQTGFFDLWLPREQEINLFVSARGKKATGKITTYKDSNTCNSKLKLE